MEPFTSFGGNMMALMFMLRALVLCVNRKKTEDWSEVQGSLEDSVYLYIVPGKWMPERGN
jgi:hypothetical protein